MWSKSVLATTSRFAVWSENRNCGCKKPIIFTWLFTVEHTFRCCQLLQVCALKSQGLPVEPHQGCMFWQHLYRWMGATWYIISHRWYKGWIEIVYMALRADELRARIKVSGTVLHVKTKKQAEGVLNCKKKQLNGHWGLSKTGQMSKTCWMVRCWQFNWTPDWELVSSGIVLINCWQYHRVGRPYM